MKKRFSKLSLILAIIIVINMVSITAWTSSSQNNFSKTNVNMYKDLSAVNSQTYFYHTLKSNEQKTLYQTLLANTKSSTGAFVSDKSFNIFFKRENSPTENDLLKFKNNLDFNAVTSALFKDFPQLSWIDYNKISYDVKSVDGEIVVEVKPLDSSFFIDGVKTKSDIETMQNNLNKKISQIISGVPSKDKYDQLLYINNWIIDNNSFGDNVSSLLHNILDDNHSTVTSSYGYASLFKLLSNALNIPSIIVDGKLSIDSKVVTHSWNYVNIENRWYAVDTAGNDMQVAGSYNPTDNNSRFFLVGKNTKILPYDTNNKYKNTHITTNNLYPALASNEYLYRPYYVAEVKKGNNWIYYNDLQTAIDEAKGSTIKLLRDINLQNTILIQNNTSLELNGYKITSNKNLQSLLIVFANNTLVLSSNNISGSIIQHDDDNFIISNLGNVIIKSATLIQEDFKELTGMIAGNLPVIYAKSTLAYDGDKVIVREVSEPTVNTPIINIGDSTLPTNNVAELTKYLNGDDKPKLFVQYKYSGDKVEDIYIPQYNFSTTETGDLVNNKTYKYTTTLFNYEISVDVIFTESAQPIIGSVSITGTAEFGTTITAKTETTITSQLNYEWYVDTKIVQSGPKNEYTVQSDDWGREIFVYVKADGYTGTLKSNILIGKKTLPNITQNPTALPIQYGQSLSEVVLENAVIAGNVPGTFIFKHGDVKPNVTDDVQSFEVIFKPTDPVSYKEVSIIIPVIVEKADVILTLPNATNIDFGQKLSESILDNGSAINPHDNTNVDGKFLWLDTTIAPQITGIYKAQFIPVDTNNYHVVSSTDINVTLNATTPEINVVLSANEQIVGQNIDIDLYIYNIYDENIRNLPNVNLTANNQPIELQATEQKNYYKAKYRVDGNVGEYVTITATSDALDGLYLQNAVSAKLLIQDLNKTELTLNMQETAIYGEDVNIEAKISSITDKDTNLTGTIEFMVDNTVISTVDVVDNFAETTIPYATLQNVGIKNVTAKFKATSTTYYGAENTSQISILKKVLEVTPIPSSNNIIQGMPLPTIDLQYNGFVGNDNKSVIINVPEVYITDLRGTTIIDSSVVGNYNINIKPSDNNAVNYILSPKTVQIYIEKNVLPVPPTIENGFLQEEHIKETDKEVKINVEKQTKITEVLMDNILNRNKVKDVVIKSKDVVIVFPKNSMNSVDNKMVYDFGMSLVKDDKEDSIIKEVPKEAKVAIAIKYNYSGPLPGKATISINVGEQFKNKELFYYYHNELTNEFELKESAIVDAMGIFTIQQSHFSDYLISDMNLVKNKVPSINLPSIIGENNNINDKLFFGSNNITVEDIRNTEENNVTLGEPTSISAFGNLLNLFPGLGSINLSTKDMLIIMIVTAISFIGTFMIYKEKYSHLD